MCVHVRFVVSSFRGFCKAWTSGSSMFEWAEKGQWASKNNEDVDLDSRKFRIGFEPLFVDYTQKGTLYVTFLLFEWLSFGLIAGKFFFVCAWVFSVPIQLNPNPPLRCYLCFIHSKHVGIFSVLRHSVRTDPTNSDAFRGHRPTNQEGYTYATPFAKVSKSRITFGQRFLHRKPLVLCREIHHQME